jgi:hypothetical protein
VPKKEETMIQGTSGWACECGEQVSYLCIHAREADETLEEKGKIEEMTTENSYNSRPLGKRVNDRSMEIDSQKRAE